MSPADLEIAKLCAGDLSFDKDVAEDSEPILPRVWGKTPPHLTSIL